MLILFTDAAWMCATFPLYGLILTADKKLYEKVNSMKSVALLSQGQWPA
jgi:hypothetical protein